MLERIIKQYAVRLVKDGVISEENETTVRYGLEIIHTSITGVGILVLLSMITFQPYAWIPFILGFAPIRTTAGGFHASHKVMCYFIMTLIFISVLGGVMLLQIPPFLFPLTAGTSLFILFLLSPVEAPNKPLNQVRRRRNRKISIAVGLINEIISISCWYFGGGGMMWELYFTGIMVANILLVIAKLINTKGVATNER